MIQQLKFGFVLADKVSVEDKCTPEEISEQEIKFVSLINQNSYWSGCYGDDYLVQLYLADRDKPPSSARKLMIDVGANKGYVMASWMSLWIPESGVNPPRLGEYMPKVLGHPHCGFCYDCKEAIHLKISNLTRTEKYSIEIHALSPNQACSKY